MIEGYKPLDMEKDVLKFWESNSIYAKAKKQNQKGKDWYFLDGPPYTSGRIHLGQAWNKSLKDAILRYKRMNGFNVWDRAGYDMHGLPTAHKVEAKFGIKHKEDIPKFGVAKFIEECRKLATENMHQMTKDFDRIGIWMDFANAYQPISKCFMEGEWWLIKKAHENKRLYEGEKTMHWCAHCSTSLAKHELEYENITDNSIFVKLKVKGKDNEYLIVWTTTPWTLAFNLGVMVHPELDYLKIKVDKETWIVSKGLVGAFMGSVVNKKYEVIEEFKGEKLKGLKYEHPWKDDIKPFADIKAEKLHSVLLSSEYVDLSAGTGLVHCAPGCGPEDYEVGHKNGLPPFNNIEEDGTFPDTMGKFSGLKAKKDDKKFIEALGDALIETTPVEHEYAHCWRCHKPVVFRTTKQWFFKVEDLVDEMKALNKKVLWQPDWAGSNWFDSWLNNLRDNGITRQRYWGTPLPIWKCEDCDNYEVIGSVKELKEKAGKVPEDLHRPFIDEVTMKCGCGGLMKRVPDILDVWIDAGTNSWTCLDFPEREDLFKRLWPAEFIIEGKDQIRGWFNLLFIASMISLKKHSYKACYMHGFVQDSNGRKMSKSLGNIISPYEVIDKFGADTLRYYMIGGANPGLDLNYNPEDVTLKNKNLIVLWNLHKFLIEYAKNLKTNPTKLDKEIEQDMFSVEDRYMISKLNSAIKKSTELFENYKLNEIPGVVEDLFLTLSRTYIQLTRDKASVGAVEDKKVVLYTIYNTLFESLKLLAPIAPFITEQIYQNFRSAFKIKQESIHLLEWPKPDPKKIDEKLEKSMNLVANIVQSALAAREKINLGVRWPLSEIIIVTEDDVTKDAIADLDGIIKKQANIRNIKVKKSIPGIKVAIKSDYKNLGPDFGEKTPAIIAKLMSESAESIVKDLQKKGKHEITINDEKLAILQKHLIIERIVPEKYQEAPFKAGFIYLNKIMTDELEAEGFSREIMRRVQNLRKKSGLQKADSISLFIKVDETLKEMLIKHEASIKEKVGAKNIKIDMLNPAKKHKFGSKEKVKGKEFEIYFDSV